jgi:hypothetical protein
MGEQERVLGARPKKTRFEPAEEQHELLEQRRYFSIFGKIPKRYVVGIMAFFGFCEYASIIFM